MSLIEPSNTMGPEPAAPADPNKSYYDTEGGLTPAEPQDVVEAPEAPAADETEQETFDRKYVEELRRENAKWRTRTHSYEETFDGMEDSLREGWLELIRLANSDDPQAMDTLAQMLGFEIEQPEEPVVPTDVPQYPTREEAAQIAREEAQRLYEADQAQRAEQAAIEGVASEAKSLGYEQGSLEYVQLLYLANEVDQSTLPPGKSLLQVAHEQLEARNQAAYDAFIARKTADAGGSPIAPSGNGTSPSIERVPKSWDDAREMLHERLTNG